MTDPHRQCRYCHGTGRNVPLPAQREPTTRGAATRMIPYGHDVAAVLAGGRLDFAPTLYCAGCAQTGKDRWETASHANAYAPGHAMVLPEGDDPASYKYPPLPRWNLPGIALCAYATGMSTDERHALGRALIVAGVEGVLVMADGCDPLTFVPE
jgi:hypothetical protein